MTPLHRDLTDQQLRWFGASLAAMLGLFAGLAYWRWQAPLVAGLLAGSAGLLLSIYYGLPDTRRPIYRALRIATQPIQLVVTTLLLAVVYYGVVTPIGLLLKLRGYDPLDRRPSGRGPTATYWRRRPPPPPAERYYKTF